MTVKRLERDGSVACEGNGHALHRNGVWKLTVQRPNLLFVAQCGCWLSAVRMSDARVAAMSDSPYITRWHCVACGGQHELK